MAIEADHYREEERALKNDPIIRELAKEVFDGLADGKVQLDDIRHRNVEDTAWGGARSSFMNTCSLEYNRRLDGLKPNLSHSIGGCARAVLALIDEWRSTDV